MDKIIAAIKERIEECKRKGAEFELPALEGCVVEKKGRETLLRLSDRGVVTISSRSVDHSQVFDPQPSKSYVDVTCSDHGHDFSDSWEESL